MIQTFIRPATGVQLVEVTSSAIASLLGILFTTAGLWLSFTLNLTSGATIILVAGIAYLLSLGVAPLASRWGNGGQRISEGE